MKKFFVSYEEFKEYRLKLEATNTYYTSFCDKGNGIFWIEEVSK